MSSRPHTTTAATKTSTVHRRSESSGHQRHSSSGSANHKSDSGQSFESEGHRERKHGHYRSKSGAHDKERIESGSSQCKDLSYVRYILINFVDYSIESYRIQICPGIT